MEQQSQLRTCPVQVQAPLDRRPWGWGAVRSWQGHKQQKLWPSANPTQSLPCAPASSLCREGVFLPGAGQPPDPDQASDPLLPKS